MPLSLLFLLSLPVLFHVDIMAVFKALEKRGVVCDVRKPDVMRIAPAPLYNTFADVHRCAFC